MVYRWTVTWFLYKILHFCMVQANVRDLVFINLYIQPAGVTYGLLLRTVCNASILRWGGAASPVSLCRDPRLRCLQAQKLSYAYFCMTYTWVQLIDTFVGQNDVVFACIFPTLTQFLSTRYCVVANLHKTLLVSYIGLWIKIQFKLIISPKYSLSLIHI